LIIPGAGRSLDLTTIEIIQQLPFSGDAPWRPEKYAYDGDRLVLRGGLSTHKHVFKSELKSG
jgi:hypothetical protein